MMMMLLFIALVVFLIGRGFFSRGSHHWGPPFHMMDRSGQSLSNPTCSALQILNERLINPKGAKSSSRQSRMRTISIIARASMLVPMVDVWHVFMRMHHRLMRVLVRVRLATIPAEIVLVLVMRVVTMRMRML